MIPKVIPKGFAFPPVVVEERMIGNKGQIQGAKIVMSPETKANNSRTIIDIYLFLPKIFPYPKPHRP